MPLRHHQQIKMNNCRGKNKNGNNPKRQTDRKIHKIESLPAKTTKVNTLVIFSVRKLTFV
jgi:hypothetical protein